MSLLLAIIGHLVGDYLLQNDWMALNKKVQLLPLSVHCSLWSLSVCSFAGWSSPVAYTVLYLTHFTQDGSDIITRWMDLIGQKHFRTGPCAPWSMIVVDNVWHIVTLWAVWRFVA